MVRFFKEVRGKLLQNNRVTHYLLYAAGEIALVVIGILIALQVSNWNETRKSRTFEVVILQEIRENVRVNLERFRALQRRLQTSDVGIHLFLSELEKTEPDQQRLARYFSILNNGIVFSYNRGAYDSFKATGLDRLSNRALRTELIDHFDSFLPRHERFIQLQYNAVLDDVNASASDFQEPVIARNDNGLWLVKLQFPTDFDWSNRHLRLVLAARAEANHAAAIRLQRLVAETEALLVSLDAEIAGRAGSSHRASQIGKPHPKWTSG